MENAHDCEHLYLKGCGRRKFFCCLRDAWRAWYDGSGDVCIVSEAK